MQNEWYPRNGPSKHRAWFEHPGIHAPRGIPTLALTAMNTAFPPLPHEYDPHYWSQRFVTEPYVREGDEFADFEPAYRFGYFLRNRIADFHGCEAACEKLWNETKEAGSMAWERVRLAVRSAWYRARMTGPANLKDALRRGEDKLCAAWAQCMQNVRRHPSGSVLGAAATGYLCHMLPLRSILVTGVKVAAAAAPTALLLLGVWKVADYAFREGAVDGRLPAPVSAGDQL
jgi:hypothetical protein